MHSQCVCAHEYIYISTYHMRIMCMYISLPRRCPWGVNLTTGHKSLWTVQLSVLHVTAENFLSFLLSPWVCWLTQTPWPLDSSSGSLLHLPIMKFSLHGWELRTPLLSTPLPNSVSWLKLLWSWEPIIIECSLAHDHGTFMMHDSTTATSTFTAFAPLLGLSYCTWHNPALFMNFSLGLFVVKASMFMRVHIHPLAGAWPLYLVSFEFSSKNG